MLDSVFIKSLAEKSDAAYRELFARYYAPLKSLAVTYVKDSATAEDLAQDVFVGLYYGGATFDSVDGLKFYLYRSMKNRIVGSVARSFARFSSTQPVMCSRSMPSARRRPHTMIPKCASLLPNMCATTPAINKNYLV